MEGCGTLAGVSMPSIHSELCMKLIAGRCCPKAEKNWYAEHCNTVIKTNASNGNSDIPVDAI
jgi:hypothetical protein